MAETEVTEQPRVLRLLTIVRDWKPTVPVHTIVLHRHPDLEALEMARLAVTLDPVRQRLGIVEAPRYKYVTAGPLRPEEWPGESAESLRAPALEARGYIFFDCGGEGATFDQHTATENRGEAEDVAASIDLLNIGSDATGRDPWLGPFLRVISENDRTGQSICAQVPYDKAGPYPHVGRDIRTMVGALNDLYPNDPDRVREIYFLAMEGLVHLFCELVLAADREKHQPAREQQDDGAEPRYVLVDFREIGQGMLLLEIRKSLEGSVDESRIDLRKVNFFTVDNAVHGIELHVRKELAWETEERREAAVAEALADFWEPVKEAWEGRERDWKQGVADFEKAERITADYHTFDGMKRIRLAVGRSGSTYFSTAARRKQQDVVVQFYPDGRFLVSRAGDRINFDRTATHLCLADARVRDARAKVVALRGIYECEIGERGSNSYVEMPDGTRIPQFYYAGFAFGNRYHSNPDGLAVSVLSPEEVVWAVRMALANRPLRDLFQAIDYGRRQAAEARKVAGKSQPQAGTSAAPRASVKAKAARKPRTTSLRAELTAVGAMDQDGNPIRIGVLGFKVLERMLG